MACFSPLSAWQLESGDIVFAERGKVLRSLTLPCGQCIGCRLERSRQWAVRCMHENQMHASSCFVTLTYDDDHVPHDYSLDYRDFQLFMKKLRQHFRRARKRSLNSSMPNYLISDEIRFFMCGEYGDNFSRPHFHACLFGAYFEDRVLFRRLDSGSNLYISETLSRLWPYGFVSIGDVTFESAAYVARYVMKKVTGVNAEEHYKIVDSCGEIRDRTPEFCHMSLKPGIGRRWYDRYCKEVFPRDRVNVRGRDMKPPKYYDRILKEDPSLMSDGVEFERYARAMRLDPSDSTPERLADRALVAKARLNQFGRKL